SFEPLPASGWDRMSSAFLLPCITPQMVDFPPIEVSEQIRPQHLEYLTQGGVTFRLVEFLLFCFQEQHFEVSRNGSVHFLL
ncbi:hypothetical protein, partial [Massilia aquatica]|uniref:hypothetical protein n=1 Tax=Massilia aquatica TaxID=2609000 RepID=UPI001A7F103C